MDDESDFQAALDANPADAVTRQVFADWLEEIGDPRAAGMRALGALGRVPVKTSATRHQGWGRCGYCSPKFYGKDHWPMNYSTLLAYLDAADAALPQPWFDLIRMSPEGHARDLWRCGETRRQIEDAAALAFAALTPDQQSAILAGALT